MVHNLIVQINAAATSNATRDKRFDNLVEQVTDMQSQLEEQKVETHRLHDKTLNSTFNSFPNFPNSHKSAPYPYPTISRDNDFNRPPKENTLIVKVNSDSTELNAHAFVESWLSTHCTKHDIKNSDYTVESSRSNSRSITITVNRDRAASSKLERLMLPLMKKGKKYIAVYVHNGQDADLTFMRDTSPRVRRAGYLLYILGTVLDSYASGLELKSDPILAVVSSKGVPLAQILFNDYNVKKCHIRQNIEDRF